MACDDLRAALVSLEAKRAALEKSVTDPFAALTQLNAINAQITQASDALNKCLEALLPQKVPGAQPKEILQIQFQTPAFGGDGSGNDWATPIAGGQFPFSQGLEWKQVMDTTNEYDTNPVGATGWAAFAQLSTNDSIGLHPFGPDWEFACVLDSEYLNLLSYGNRALQSGNTNNLDGPVITPVLTTLGIQQQDPDAIANAVKLGMLGVEWEKAIVPAIFLNEFSDGDRVAVFGRWIVDCGHDDYHTEIHPPLLMASASVYTQPSANRKFTRALFTSRPYLVGQTFANQTPPFSPSTDQIYNDSSGDNGHFFDHLTKEFLKAEATLGGIIPLGSTQVEFHPKIKQYPFQGAPHLFEFVVKAPPNKSIAEQSLVGQSFVVSFHFTIRTGCVIEVAPNDASSVRVFVTMNSALYNPPSLPTRRDQVYTLAELNAAFGPSPKDLEDEGIFTIANKLLDPAGLAVLSRGLKTDLYDPLPVVNVQDSTSPDAVVNQPGTSIPTGKGITLDNTQPYPVFGWIEVGYAGSQTLAQPTVTTSSAGPVTQTEVKPVVANPVTVRPPSSPTTAKSPISKPPIEEK